MPKIRANGLSLHYWQSGSGPDMVLVHGLGGNLAGWHLTMVPELQRDYRITTYDLRGHGRSDGPLGGYTTRDMADDLCGLMDALKIRQASVVGHSWGADIALHFGLVHGERASELILIEPGLLAPFSDRYRDKNWEGWPYVTSTLEGLLGAPIPADKQSDLEYLIKLLIEIPILYGPARGQIRDEQVLQRVLDILMPVWKGDAPGGELTVDAVSRIPHRTLAIREANSVFLAAFEALRERMPRFTVGLLPSGKLKHFTSLEQPELIVEHIKAFLQPERAAPALESR
jgi:pimeloyl-ACP methyl ester carboxylesterase